MPYNEEATLNSFRDLLKTVKKLRAPDGCPWDREQTHQSLRPFLVEETYETIEVMDQIHTPQDLIQKPELKKAFVEEWGDVLLQILLNAEIASETTQDASIEHMISGLNEKLIRRHPHVFGDVKVQDTGEVLKNWDAIKKVEKGQNSNSNESILQSVTKGLPPIPRTMKIIQKVTKVGFQWPDLEGPTAKLDEEVLELKQALQELSAQSKTHHNDNTQNISKMDPKKFISTDDFNHPLQQVESELGDVLFSVCNIAYFLKLDPEAALRSTLRKFESRFQFVEKRFHEQGKKITEAPLSEMDQYWDEAKAQERNLNKHGNL